MIFSRRRSTRLRRRSPRVAKGSSSPGRRTGSTTVPRPLTCSQLHASRSHARDQALDPLVVGPERVLAEHGPLGLIVELEVHPVYGEVAPLLLGVSDELAPKPGPGGLRRGLLGLEDLQLGGPPVGRLLALQQCV